MVARKHTNRLYDLMDAGVVTPEQIVDMCLGYMSDSDVGDMVDANELSPRFMEDNYDCE